MRKVIFSSLAALLCLPLAGVSKSTMLTSWYGGYFHGRTTANGETYNMYGHSAAHKTLDFGTELRVCYRGCVDVVVNDRGPFVGARELDLSYGAARAIGMVDVGVANVEVTYL